MVTDTPLWWGTSIMEKAMPMQGQGTYEKSLYLPLNFVVCLKMLYQAKFSAYLETPWGSRDLAR